MFQQQLDHLEGIRHYINTLVQKMPGDFRVGGVAGLINRPVQDRIAVFVHFIGVGAVFKQEFENFGVEYVRSRKAQDGVSVIGFRRGVRAIV